ncbi:hypothetical protein CFC21_090656 [Triticum aestivum]|uniref:Non-haem dioxygenase N-terminal domain-containing protein n=2 Tax=Triticum aestivum TaxID=4565 RepID=A0A3B6Q8C5_WHEAT|nr:hypothetical protein CFC21_090656 [Triticum aestivum]
MRTQTMRLRCDLPAHNSVRYTSRNQVKMKTPTTKLMFDLPAHNSVPDKYIMPAEKRPRRHELVDDGLSVALPVVDLKKGRPQVARDILEAGKEFGFFQVVNHGVGEDVVQGFREVAAEFLRLPEEAKLEYYSEDQSKAFRVISGCITSHKLMNEWPTQPEIFSRLTNGLLASVEHRVVTNSAKARMSVASLVRPRVDCRIGPASVMVDEETNPPKYRDFTYSEFTEAYEATLGNREAMLDFFKIQAITSNGAKND